MAKIKRELTVKQQLELSDIQAEIIKAVAISDMPRLRECQVLLFDWICQQIDQAILTEVTPFVQMSVVKGKL